MSVNIKTIYNYQTEKGIHYEKMNISFQLFGKKLHTAQVVVVIHALTGNSDVASEKSGWWKQIIGEGKVIDTNKYTILSFDIPGNGYSDNTIEKYKDFSTKDIAKLFIETLESLGRDKIYAVIGGSLGGGIAWEIAALKPRFVKYLIPIACDWKTPDWIIAHNYVQEDILTNSTHPLKTARMMAMMFYRTPQSFTEKFNRTKNDDDVYNVESWLNHHGDKLIERYSLAAYRMMNHLLTTVDITDENTTFEEVAMPIQSNIINIGIDSDLFFINDRIIETDKILKKINVKSEFHEIKSIHGHDAFLIEYEQLTQILKPIFD